MKIIQIDNFARENVSEQLIAENVSEYWSARIVMLLNGKYSGNDTSFYCQAMTDDYKLFIYEP